jgi:RNA polymerase-interacting CarD/CdnL/TRCF family regulator
LHKQSKFLAALLKRTTAKELEAQEELIIQQALSYAQAEIAVNNTEEH